MSVGWIESIRKCSTWLQFFIANLHHGSGNCACRREPDSEEAEFTVTDLFKVFEPCLLICELGYHNMDSRTHGRFH